MGLGTELGIFLDDVQEESLSGKLVNFRALFGAHATKTMSSLSDHDEDCHTRDVAPNPPTTDEITYANIDMANPTVETTVLNNPNPPRTTHSNVVDEKQLTAESHLMFSWNPCPGTYYSSRHVLYLYIVSCQPGSLKFPILFEFPFH